MKNTTQPPFPSNWIRQTIDNLRDDITQVELDRIKHGHSSRIVEVVDPGKGMDSEPTNGLIDITYQCDDRPRKGREYPCHYFETGEHTHGAVYGPEIIQFSDDCKHCKLSKYKEHPKHTYEPIGYEIVNWEKFELYAD